MELPIRRKIAQLSKAVADRIAAGEVVERPISVVKELMENALDSGADSVAIEIKDGGRTYIRVTDNGCGIPEDEMDLAFQRHATSKIVSDKDLESIDTLGFRGEALASIASVARVELITKTKEAETGTRFCIEGGEAVEKGPTGCPDGTTILVRDLFYNTPARLKFLKRDSAEGSLIVDFVSKMALAYPTIRIRMINNGSILFATNGKGEIYPNICTIYSREIGEHLLEGRDARGGMQLQCWVSPPQESRSSRKNQIFFVNGRNISSKLLENAVTEAYKERMFEGRFPAAFLFLKVPPEELDVNIHPNKKEVRFSNEDEVKEFVTDVIRNALSGRKAIPEIRRSGENGKQDALTGEQSIKPKSPSAFPGKQDAPATPEKPTPPASDPAKKDDIRNILLTMREEEDRRKQQQTTPVSPEKTAKNQQKQEFLKERQEPVEPAAAAPLPRDPIAVPSEMPDDNERMSDSSASKERQTETNKAEPKETQEKLPISSIVSEESETYGGSAAPRFDPGSIQITGSVFATYITGSDDTYFYLIDQHAAHERICYEALRAKDAKEKNHTQMLLTSILLEAVRSVQAREEEWLPVLREMGFDIEPFGGASYIVKAIPMVFSLTEAKQFLDDFLDSLADVPQAYDARRMDKIIMASCKSAVKANDRLTPEEMRRLLADLARCENPFSCPHGRPTMIKMSRSEIEHLFKRS